MSNYQVEPVHKPQALTTEAIKALRHEQVQGVSRRELLRGSLAAGMGLWLLEVTAGHDRLPVAQPRRASSAATSRSATFDDDQDRQLHAADRRRLPGLRLGGQGVRRADRPLPAAVHPGRRTSTGDGTAVNVRALYQRCPHLGCKPNPCQKNFWMECPCHGSRYDRLGIKALGAAVRAGAAEHGPLRRQGRRATACSPSTPARSPSARCRSPSASPGSSRRAPPPGASDLRHRPPLARPPRRPMTDQPGRPPEERLPAPRPSSAPAPADRFSAPPSAHRNDLTPERAARIVRQSANARWVGFLAVTIVGAVRHRLLLLRARPARRADEPRLDAAADGPAGHGRASAATTSTRPTAPSATASTARAARARSSTARTSCSPTSTRTTSGTCSRSAVATRAATRPASCRSGRTPGTRPARSTTSRSTT